MIAFTLPAFRHMVLRSVKKWSSRSGTSTNDKGGYPNSNKMSRLQKEGKKLGSRDTNRGRVLIETTVTLKEESTEDFHPGDSETELGVFDNGMLRGKLGVWVED